MTTKEILERLVNHQDLSEAEAELLMGRMMGGDLSPVETSALLIALRSKGESTQELTAFAKVMRAHATPIAVEGDLIIDTCGTGGDGSGSYNLSTTVALLLAGGGYKVAKHGNRSMTSQSGSADLLEALGVKIDLSPIQVSTLIAETGFGFLFAPALHAAMKHVVPIRRELAIRTVFNLLGPLTNPAGANVQIIGLFDKNRVGQIAQVLAALGSKAAYVVAGEDGLDEVSIGGMTQVARLKDGKTESFLFDPTAHGFALAGLDQIKGGSPKDNAEITLSLLSGQTVGPKRDLLAINAGFAISAAKDCGIKEGIEEAQGLIDSGKGLLAVQRIRTLSHEV
ncbi:MAG: anthranilate phosphoribosyltransferase [Candidatus Lambdaproteobacteria bacterium RIFOXYD2_FULL_50_16]|uniref:Anthranilate phosphoribosyltransferase n=1 Tax=Candidatus Lambdaproteobacteria bacterium RIFOXYD2_FULL_50_16 TaxID=1817772 RepID=A0A1F6GDP4_9PROT|nr:MAG: anthranilate phosphoribosyltransferase [Candidatus Lambdaproteobacteria bacterium RIFOXYD2_FULL_50_16]